MVLSEGDSWFSFPVHANIIDHLDELVNRRMSLLRLEDPGDELLEIMGGRQFGDLRKYLRRYRPHAVLFSGGGNDIAGPDLLTLVAPRTAPFDINTALDTQALHDRLLAPNNALQQLIDLRNELAPDCLIITHGYADAIPSGRKAYLWGISAGPWIKPFLAARGYDDAGEQRALIRALIDRFHTLHETLQKHNRRFHALDLRPHITDDDWNDELHLTREGFRRAATAFHAVLQEELPTFFPSLE